MRVQDHLSRPSATPKPTTEDSRHPPITASTLVHSHPYEVVHDHLYADITRLRYQFSPKLVYLSGCGTAQSGTRLADEAIHVSSAFQVSGFEHVIGTLWPVHDRVAASMAEAFYSQVHAGLADPAFAIQQTARWLRNRYPAAPILWAPMIHLGISRGSPNESSPMVESPASEAMVAFIPQDRSRGTVTGTAVPVANER
ncbi:CHAT domain-containing protein [Streptomyces davaonensis]|uniref:CHAT domain-containing protein n=1 Tax=Streptomyces davaonensis TaxID=348043 RepID=UPI000997EFCC